MRRSVPRGRRASVQVKDQETASADHSQDHRFPWCTRDLLDPDLYLFFHAYCVAYLFGDWAKELVSSCG
jgi:hypothetical protein